MHKLILVAAMVLLSASAQASGNRGLTMASSDQPAIAAQPDAQQSSAAQAQQSVARPSLRQQSGQAMEQRQRMRLHQGPQVSGDHRMHRPDPITAAKYAVAIRVGQLRRQGASTLAHVRYALHRHGIYW
jgi:hypothetical protein